MPTTTSPRRTSTRRAAEGGDPARAGRQQPDRNRVRVRPRRLRGVRRAHERPDPRPLQAGRTSPASSPAAASATATCSVPAAAGRPRCWNAPRCARRSPRSSSAIDSFALGVCNGCQMLSQLKDLIPGAQHWPQFLRNAQRAVRRPRLALLEVVESPSLFLPRHGRLAHPGGGRARRRPRRVRQPPATRARARVALRYINGDGEPATTLSGQSERLGRRASPA